MQNISLPAHFHKKTCNADAATNSFYDDVFSGPTKFPLPPPSLSPRLQDYAEIFGAFNSRSSSSIPVLDLPVSVGDEDFFFDARSSCFDYSEVFGGIEGSDFATSFEELVRMSGAGDDEAWSPEEGDYLSEESEGSLKSEGFSNRESCEYVIDGNDVKFNISYNKNGGRSGCEDVAQSLPEYSFLVEKASSLPKMDDDDDDDYVDMRLSDDGHFNIDLSREMVIERPLKKTVSNLVNGDRKSGMLFEDDVRTRRDYVRTGSFPGESFVTISDVNLKTRPSKVPPPLRPPPPALEVKKKDSDELIHNGKASAFERSAGDGFLPFFDVEVDANSSAAVSAAAIKDAMEKAQAKMKSAKELMDRKREGFQSRTKSGLKDHKKDREGNIGRSIDGLGSNDGIETEIAERQYVKRTNRLVQSSLEGENYPNGSKREENQSRKSLSSSSQGPVKIDEASEWKEATEFFELVRTDKSKNIFDNVITESMSARSTNVIEHGRMEQKENDKKGKPACRELEEYERKACVSKEVSASQESNGRLEAAAVVVQRQKGLQRKAQSSKEASRQKENEKKLMKDMQLAETVRKHLITDDYEVYENMEMPYQEIKLEEMEAKQHKEKEPHSEEANKRSDEDKGFTHEKKGLERKKREAMGKLDNEKKLNAALEQANKERRLKEDMMEETEKEKRMEANEREENKKNKKEALEREENARRLREALEREENERRLDEALEREENERRRMEAYKREENEKSLREAHEREENEKRLREAFEKQENERRQRETLEKEQKERRLREALEKEENLRRLKQKLDKEENERRLRQKLEKEENERLRQKLEKEENERRLREKLEKEENERRQRSAAEQEENEKRQRETFEREENERLKVALVKKEDNRERQACEKVENNLLKKACGKEEIQKVRRDDFGNIKTDSTGKIPEKIVRESNSLRGAQVGNGAEEGLKEIYNLEDFEDTSLEAHKPDSLEDAVDTGELRNAEDGLRSNQNGAAGANANIDGEKTPSELCQDDLEHENASEIPSEDGSLKSADEAGHNLPPMKFASHKSSALNQGKSYTNESNEKGSKNEKAQVSQHHQDRKDSFSSTRMVKEIFVSGKKVEATQPATSEMKGNTLRPAQQVNVNQAAERKTKNGGDTISVEDKEIERIKREKELEMERLRKMEEERDREREREKDRMAVDLATLEARERANSDARERAERAGIERALAEARQRAINEARERLEKACAEAREKSLSDKASVEARIRAERAAVERATAEARERAFEKAMAERAASEARERLERSVSDKFSTSSRKTWMRQSSLSSDVQDMQMQNSGSFNDSRYQYSSVYGGSYNMERSNGFDGESPQRCKARLERHRRTAERAAKALAEKNMRDLLAQREQAERNRIAETLDAEVRRWSSGKQGNLRALLSTLQYILGPDSGWHPIPLTEVITSAAVKKAYRKATLCVHPDKLQQRGASIHQKYICEKVFDLLKEAWNKFNSEER